MTLPLLDVESNCPKCGVGEATVAYQAPNRWHQEWLNFRETVCDEKEEHFHRACKTCHYKWAEAIDLTTEA